VFNGKTPGHFEMIIGPMFSGKSGELFQRVRGYQVLGRGVELYKPKSEDRYATGKIVTHYGGSMDATPIECAEDLLRLVSPKTDVVGIDEAQFLDDGIIDVCLELRGSYDLIVTALTHSFLHRPFPFRDSERDVFELVAEASRIDQLRALCNESDDGEICGKPAFWNQRYIDGEIAPADSPLFMLGSEDSYKAVCDRHKHEYPR